MTSFKNKSRWLRKNKSHYKFSSVFDDDIYYYINLKKKKKTSVYTKKSLGPAKEKTIHSLQQ